MFPARRLLAALLVSALGSSVAAPAGATTLFDPALKFRALPTAHFVIYFHQGEDRLAQRLARIAEEAWQALRLPLGVTPPPRTHVVLADQTELFNGYATPLPYDTIVIYPVAPSGASFNFDEWLRLVFTHEFTHIMHLDRSEGWARRIRSLFGRTPYAFPNLFLPAWQTEGLATYEETAITGEGRAHAGDFRAIVGEAARQHRLEPLDRVNGGLTDWPGGNAAYAYGEGFHQYLADRFGADTLASLAHATARRVPFLASGAFANVYGERLGTLWREYEDSIEATTGPRDDAAITRLTHQGFSVSGPRFDRYGDGILYSAVNPHGFPALYRIDLDGGEPHQVTTRYLGSTTGPGRDRVYFDQVEQQRSIGLYSDLYSWSRADGRVRQLTNGARLQDPDLSPDGETLVCVQNRPGQRDLVLVSIARLTSRATGDVAHDFSRAITILLAEPDTQFDAPKWSPDGRTIAVERHRLGAMPEIVTVDASTRVVRVVAAAPRTRFVMPTWRPDGRAIIAAAAPDEQTFNLFEFTLEGSASRQLTHTTGGALWPDVSPDAHTIVFTGYTADGYDLFSMPYPEAPSAAAELSVRVNGGNVGPADLNGPNADALRTATEYSPLSTLKPTSWIPIVESRADQLRAGAGVSGYDVLGYHAYAANATWLVSSTPDAPRPSAATPDWQLSYVYGRWLPSVFVSATSATSFFAGPATDAGAPRSATLRERQIEAGVRLPIRRTRIQHAAQISIARTVGDYTLADGGGYSRERTPLRLTWRTLTAHTYGYSISQEGGIAAGATTEIVRRGFGSSADATITTGDFRAYLPGPAPHHVVALRLAGGASLGDSTVGRTFLLGGDEPGAGVADLGSSAMALLRGFRPDTFAGSRVGTISAEYRWPLARPQRGLGTWPLFLHSVHAAVFADAGHAWTSTFRADAIKSSAGAQLSADLIAGYFTPLTATVGAAWGHDGSGRVADAVTVYFRVGKAF